MIVSHSKVAAMFLLPLLAVGCGKAKEPRGIVRGQVTLAGQPVSDAQVLFQSTSAGGESITAPLGSDGNYEVRSFDQANGLPAGTYKVAILPPVAQVPGLAVPGDLQAKTAQPFTVPEKYRSPDTSGLSITVSNGKNEPFDFRL